MSYLTNPYMVTSVPSCSDEYVITNTGTSGSVASNADCVWVSKTSTSVSEGDKISAIATHISATTGQPYNAKYVCYSGDSSIPSTFMCMTESADFNNDDWVELDVVNASGSVESHTITGGEAGVLWLGVWSGANVYSSVLTGITGGTKEMGTGGTETYSSSNTAKPTASWSDDGGAGVQIRMRATVCVF